MNSRRAEAALTNRRAARASSGLLPASAPRATSLDRGQPLCMRTFAIPEFFAGYVV
jgi:hypothetical protein